MDENNTKPEAKNYLKSKPRFEILDGLRGIASIIVIIFHFFEVYSFGNPAEQKVINHGYLAVDFFIFFQDLSLVMLMMIVGIKCLILIFIKGV